MDIARKASNNIRRLIVASVERANSGHPGGAMGAAEFMHVLFSEFLEFDPENPDWDLRDRFFMDPGHMSALLYSVQALFGKYSIEDLKNFRQWGSVTPGHPERDIGRGIENTSGPLGLGHVMGVGAAIAEKFFEARFGSFLKHNIFAFISDGGIQEEISQGAGRIAGHLGLDNFIMFYDSNEVQLSTETKDVTTEDVAAKYLAWGWQVITVNGYDVQGLRKALRDSTENKKQPSLIIGKTKIAYGAVDADGNSLEGKVSTHGAPFGEEASRKTIIKLGGDPDSPFQIDPEVLDYYENRKGFLRNLCARREKMRKEWSKKNPVLSSRYEGFLKGSFPDIDFSSIELKKNISTRVASGAVLGALAEKPGNMIVCSADLCNSDKTEEFLKKTGGFRKGDFSGAFLQVGVSELTMAALMTGMAAHGGVIPVGGTFFVFSDYMKPAVRIAALMRLPVIFVWSHDSFRVGEDGPTHQPVEHEAQLRLLEQMENEKGERAFLALRPADGAETLVAWKIALENRSSPTALILSRQGIYDLPAYGRGSRMDCAFSATKGAYIVSENDGKPDLILLANGSEVSLCEAVAGILRKKHVITVRVVSVPSEGLFRAQSGDYQEKILPPGVAILGVTAGLPRTLEGLARPCGRVYGLSRFGASAPLKVLNEKFGFTTEALEKVAIEFLSDWKKQASALIKSLQKGL